MKEKNERIVELEEGLRHADMEQDRVITRMEKEHAEEIQRLVRQADSSDGTVNHDNLVQKQEELEVAKKDLYYYKQSYRELKRTLKKIQTAVKEDLDKKQAECDVLVSENMQLREELQNLKQFMSRNSGTGAAPVRMSRSSLKSLKVLNAEEIEQRKSQQVPPNSP